MKNRVHKKWLWILLPLLIVAGIVFTLREEQISSCKGVSIETVPEVFLTKSEISRLLFPSGENIVGKNPGQVPVSKLKKKLATSPYISESDIYFTTSNILKVKVKQRVPIAVLYDNYGSSVYLTEDQTIVASSKRAASRLMVANGYFIDTLKKYHGQNIATIKNEPLLKDIYETVKILNNDSLYSSLIGQIHINKEREIELTPTIDQHTILIGNSDSLNYKLHKLFAFYRKGFPRTGWDTYTKINLKHSNQVICSTKKD